MKYEWNIASTTCTSGYNEITEERWKLKDTEHRKTVGDYSNDGAEISKSIRAKRQIVEVPAGEITENSGENYIVHATSREDTNTTR